MDSISLSEAVPTASEYRDLRARAGWGLIPEDVADITLRSASFTLALRHEGRLVGLARVMGDGVLYFFLADLIVDPAFRGQRLGDRLMQAVTEDFDRCAVPGASIVLVPLKGSESFYERFGFVRCPDGPFGTGMHYAAAPPPVQSD